MTVAVTGGSGHIGNNLIRELVAAGRKVRALIHGGDERSLEGLPIERVPGDVRDRASLDRAFADVDVVYHLAAHISISEADDKHVEGVNVEGTRNVVGASLKAGVRRLVHFSSVHALWGHPKDRPIDELQESSDRPDALPYDRSKAQGEKAVLAGVQNGLDAVIVNPGAVVGPNDYSPSRMGSFLIDLCRRRLPALIEGGYSWVDVRDVVQGALAAEQRGRRGERYLLSGHPLSIKELAMEVEQISGVRAPRMVTPQWVAQLAAPGAMFFSKVLGRQPKFTSHAVQILGGNYQFRIDKARRELGYAPRPIQETMRDTIDWFRTTGYL